MNRIIKSIGFVMLFTLVLFYCVKSIYSFKDSTVKLYTLTPKYNALLQEYQELNVELSTLQYKVNGIREETLNLEVLEERIKTMLNLKNADEVLLTN